MKIAQSNVTQASYSRYTQRGMQMSNGNIFSFNTPEKEDNKEYAGNTEEATSPKVTNQNETRKNQATTAATGTSKVSSSDKYSGAIESLDDLRNRIFLILLARILGIFGLTKDEIDDRLSMADAYAASGSTVSFASYYEETEFTSYSTEGVVVTESGESISFNLDLQMSRSYAEYMEVRNPSYASVLCDPLIINVQNAACEIKDQTFMFDLDVDGMKDNIGVLDKGSGFLALDKNDDGVINDGSELFGTASGDGFKDLAEYDLDNNGWIDENDEVFNKLKVWCRDDEGNDILLSLKEADVGAIYLKSSPTEFTLRDINDTNGVIRSTGFFLKEGGGIGTIQHVDLSLRQRYENYMAEAL